MSQSLEYLLDLILDTRRRRRIQQNAERAQTESAVHDTHIELERRQTRFCTEVRSLIKEAVERANCHLATRPDGCRLCEVSGYYTGPLYVGGSACNPIAYELRVGGTEVGETLIIELAHDGMVEAFLGPFRPSVSEAHTTRIDFGWHSIPLYMFDGKNASDLLIRYLTALTMRWQFGRENAGEMIRHSKRKMPV
jgi:hypothetical protein